MLRCAPSGHMSALQQGLTSRPGIPSFWQVPEDPMKGKHPLWELRTKEQAEAFWKQEFGHLGGGVEGQQQAEAEGRHAGQATLV